jgi:hypothetical protein
VICQCFCWGALDGSSPHLWRNLISTATLGLTCTNVGCIDWCHCCPLQCQSKFYSISGPTCCRGSTKHLETVDRPWHGSWHHIEVCVWAHTVEYVIISRRPELRVCSQIVQSIASWWGHACDEALCSLLLCCLYHWAFTVISLWAIWKHDQTFCVTMQPSHLHCYWSGTRATHHVFVELYPIFYFRTMSNNITVIFVLSHTFTKNLAFMIINHALAKSSVLPVGLSFK